MFSLLNNFYFCVYFFVLSWYYNTRIFGAFITLLIIKYLIANQKIYTTEYQN